MIKRVSDIVEVITGKTPSSLTPEHFGAHLPFITPSDMNGKRRIQAPERWLSQEGAAALRSRIIERAVAVSCIGWQMGKAVLLETPAVTNQQLNSIVVYEDRADLLFVYYSMLSKREEIFRRGSGGSRTPILNKTDFEQLELWVPPLPSQRAVADLLGVLDDKIELNENITRNIDTLSAQVFQSWFVDFDPVPSKRKGMTPIGVPPEAIELFPSHFQDSELGPIPSGWSVKPLSAFLIRQIGGVWGEDVRSEKAPVAAISLRGIDCHALAECEMPDARPRWFTQRELNDRTLRGGELLIEGSGSFCGRSLLVDTATLGLFSDTVTYSNFCKRFDASQSSAYGVLAWFALRDEYRGGSLDVYRIGSAFPNFDADGALRNIKLALPDNPSLPRVFESVWKTLRDQQVALMAESRTLAELRDTLLGPLLSGELTIKSAENAVGAAL
jgi:type I restriction enzyme S subunit